MPRSFTTDIRPSRPTAMPTFSLPSLRRGSSTLGTSTQPRTLSRSATQTILPMGPPPSMVTVTDASSPLSMAPIMAVPIRVRPSAAATTGVAQ